LALPSTAADAPPNTQHPTPNTQYPIPNADYLLGPEDQLTVAVLGAAEYPEFAQPWLVTVRPDGEVSLGRLGEMTAAGKTSAQLKGEIETGLRRFFRKPPQVAVAISGFRQPGLVYVFVEGE